MVAAGTAEADLEEMDPIFRVVEGGQTVPGGNKMVLNMTDRVPVMVTIMEETDQITTVGVETVEGVILTITNGIDKVVLDGGFPEAEITLGRGVVSEVVATRFLRGVRAVRGNIHRDLDREAVVGITFHREVEATMGHLVVWVEQEDEEDHVALADPAVEVLMVLAVMAAVIIALPQVEVVISVHEVEATALMPALPVGPLAGVDHVEAPMVGVAVGRDPRAPVKAQAWTLAQMVMLDQEKRDLLEVLVVAEVPIGTSLRIEKTNINPRSADVTKVIHLAARLKKKSNKMLSLKIKGLFLFLN
mmetsp:Transcript_28856/g.34285  ORF Transcript_28856/g.34285 Transcript_28856/m.34285 type:complete len:303 (-) Transcript_28856:1016-1924(-)